MEYPPTVTSLARLPKNRQDADCVHAGCAGGHAGHAGGP